MKQTRNNILFSPEEAHICSSPGLSISLNYRPCHDCPSRYLRWHQLLVLLGRRKSVGSVVRSFLLQPSEQFNATEDDTHSLNTRLVKRALVLALGPSAPCYLILCDGQEAVVIVKDYITGTVRSARGFIAQTNHDPGDHERDAAEQHENGTAYPHGRREVITSAFGVEGWVEESTDRLQCLQEKWDRLVHRVSARKLTVPLATTPSITERTLRRWVSDYPTLNECSHFTAILDPAMGKIRWLMRGPVEDCEG